MNLKSNKKVTIRGLFYLIGMFFSLAFKTLVMNKNFISPLIIILFIILGSLRAQPLFKKSTIYGDQLYSICETPFGYLATGFSQKVDPIQGDLLVISVNFAGDTLWSNIFEHPGMDWGATITRLHDGTYLVCGNTSTDPFLMKIGLQGNIIWKKAYNINANWNRFSNAFEASDSTIIISGVFELNANDKRSFLCKVSMNGNIIWMKNYKTQLGTSLASNAKELMDGSMVLVGSSEPGFAYVLKTDANGVYQWDKSYQGTATPGSGHSGFVHVCETPRSGLLFYGSTSHQYGNQSKPFIVNTNMAGDTLWSKLLNIPDYGHCQFKKLPDSNYVLGGILMIKIDTTGNILWARDIKSTVYDFIPDLNSGLACAGVVEGGKGCILKIDPFGHTNCSDTAVSITSSRISYSVSPGYSNTYNTPVFTELGYAVIKSNGSSVTNACITTSITTEIFQRNQDNTLSIYPNPFSESFYIIRSENIENVLPITVYDLLGKAVFYETISGGLIQKEISVPLNSGVYFVKVGNSFFKMIKN